MQGEEFGLDFRGGCVGCAGGGGDLGGVAWDGGAEVGFEGGDVGVGEEGGDIGVGDVG